MATGQCARVQGRTAESSPGTVKTASYVTECEETKDIVDTACRGRKFNTLAAALQAAGLVDVLKGGDRSPFRPDRRGFREAAKGTGGGLLKRRTRRVGRDPHLPRGFGRGRRPTRSSKMTSDHRERPTRRHQRMKDSEVWLDQRCWVTTTDIACSNGVIHVIDSVIMPSDRRSSDGGSVVQALLAAIDAAGLKVGLEGTGPFTGHRADGPAFETPPGTVEISSSRRTKQAGGVLKSSCAPRTRLRTVMTMKGASRPCRVRRFAIRVPGRKGLDRQQRQAMANVVTPDVGELAASST